MKIICLIPHTVPKVHHETSKKKVECLFLLGVLEQDNNPEQGSPSSAQPKTKQN